MHWIDKLANVRLTSIAAIEEKIPEKIETHNKDLLRDGILGAIVFQEVSILNTLIAKIKSSIMLLKYGIERDSGTLKALEGLYKEIAQNVIPQEWKLYPSNLNLKSWIDDLRERIAFFQKWMDDGAPNVLWIGAFAYPQALFTCKF